MPKIKAAAGFLAAASMFAVFLAFGVAAKPVPAKYGSYVNALGQLRTARAYIEHPDSGELHQQEKDAMAEMDMAIAALESVANDGKGPGDHDSLDSHLRWIPRLNKSIDLLNKAHDNVQKENDGSDAKDQALLHIAKAHKFVEQAIALEQ
jgi:hypothetical protein